MEKIGIVFSNKSNYSYQTQMIQIIKKLNIKVITIKNETNDYKTFYNLGKMLSTKQINRAIVIDDFGTLPFMILAKIPGLIVAQISDEHSAHMTSEHNGANVICLGVKLNSTLTLRRIIAKFVQQPFAAGRHLVRTEMLAEMLKKERVN